MKRNELEQWQNAVDTVEDETRDHLDMEIPPLKIGDQWKGPDGRLWEQVEILYGAVGGRWCYWKHVKAELGRVEGSGSFTGSGGIIVDTIFNGWSPFFGGMLRIPYDGHVKESLMLVKGGLPSQPINP